jgi:hypothetical protein
MESKPGSSFLFLTRFLHANRYPFRSKTLYLIVDGHDAAHLVGRPRRRNDDDQIGPVPSDGAGACHAGERAKLCRASTSSKKS